MIMYDLTGTAASRPGRRGWRTAQINQVLASPEAAGTVSTVVHEATHQIAFNCGLHARYSDCPLWFSEGIAMYFETPDLHSAKGWAGVGAVNRSRLAQFQQYLAAAAGRLAQDARSKPTSGSATSKQAADAYAEAWALTYFLLRQALQGVRRVLEAALAEAAAGPGRSGAAAGGVREAVSAPGRSSTPSFCASCRRGAGSRD